MGKQNKGVTLVALVVAIIVLVILATISIGMVLGNEGIFTQANEAKKITANSQVAEEEGFNELYKQLEGYISQKEQEENFGNDMPHVSVGEIAKENSTINGYNASYDNPTIPKGFKAINVAKADWKIKDSYKNGLVIEDATSSITKGSQFVWIPVENYDNFCLREGYNSGILEDKLSETVNPSREAGASKTIILPGKPNSANTVLRNRRKCKHV